MLLFIWCAPAKMLIANYERIKWIREFACTMWYKWSMWNQVESPIIDSKLILLFNVMQSLFIKCIWQRKFNGIKYIYFLFFRSFETKIMMRDRCIQSHWSNISGKFTFLFLKFSYFHIWMSNFISLQFWFFCCNSYHLRMLPTHIKICQVKGIWRMQVVHFWDIAIL